MKIKYQAEPISPSEGDNAIVINEFYNCNSLEDLVNCINKWSPFQLSKMVSLHVFYLLANLNSFSIFSFFPQTLLQEWVYVLNKIDEYLGIILTDHRKSLICQTNCDIPQTIPPEHVLITLCMMLDFTSSLLEQSYGKEIYNSVEVKESLFRI
jgi:hypothetical protein